MSHKTLHRVPTALALTLAALLTTTPAIAAPKTEGKKEAVKPAAEKIPPFCTVALGEPPISCAKGWEAYFYMQANTWVCCIHSPHSS